MRRRRLRAVWQPALLASCELGFVLCNACLCGPPSVWRLALALALGPAASGCTYRRGDSGDRLWANLSVTMCARARASVGLAGTHPWEPRCRVRCVCVTACLVGWILGWLVLRHLFEMMFETQTAFDGPLHSFLIQNRSHPTPPSTDHRIVPCSIPVSTTTFQNVTDSSLNGLHRPTTLITVAVCTDRLRLLSGRGMFTSLSLRTGRACAHAALGLAASHWAARV